MTSREVAEAVGTEGTESLDRKRERLRKVVQEPSERDLAARELLEVESDIAARDRTALAAEAEKRMLGIVRALGSLADQSKLDNNRLLDAARKFAEQIEILNDRFEKCIALRHEAVALGEVFGLPMPDLPTVIVPASRKDVQEAFEITSRVGVRDNGRVDPLYESVRLPDGRSGHGARSFAEDELAGTPGLALIKRRLGLA